MKSPSNEDLDRRLAELEQELARLKAAGLDEPVPVACPLAPHADVVVDSDSDQAYFWVKVNATWYISGPVVKGRAEAIKAWNEGWARVRT